MTSTALDQQRQKRGPLRTAFTKTANSLEEDLKATAPSGDKLASLLAQLEEKGERLAVVDSEIERLLQIQGCTQDEFDANFEAAEAYRERLADLRTRTNRLISRLEDGRRSESSSERDDSSTLRTRKYRLPELELRKFGGDTKDWLAFWGQFKKINDDDSLDPSDKYQYLLQATVPFSRAREVVESFAPSPESFAKAIESLKNRFGRDEVLVEVYVRELLRLVLSNAVNPAHGVLINTLYDRLETQLRSLEVLGVTTDKYAAMLYPLVESSLPEDVLRAWQRTSGFVTGNVTGESEQELRAPTRLDRLMSFLKQEVEGEERIKMARAGFGLEPDKGKLKVKKSVSSATSDVPTAAGLFNGSQSSASSGSENKAVQNCVFCDKGHPSQDCNKAVDQSLDERKKVLQSKKCCFICLKRGHISRFCRFKVMCPVCRKRHFAILCPEVPAHKSCDASTVTEGEARSSKNSVLGNFACSEVLLQTLVVRLNGPKEKRNVRILIDTGSQRSYISRSAVTVAGLVETGREKVIHSLFGGLESSEASHHRFHISLSSLDDGFECDLDVLDQSTICGKIPKVTTGPWTVELQKYGITLSDQVITDVSAEVEVLVGADVAGTLLTGRVVPLECGPVAVQTKLGWTLMGRSSVPLRENVGCALTVTTLLVQDSSVTCLWDLDCLGIRDPLEQRSRKEALEYTMDQFAKTVKRDPDGRFEVALPWSVDHPPLPSNRHIAEKRLKPTVEKLRSDGRLADYQAIFNEWLAEGIIERVPEEELSNFGHYLPHRAIIKESSETTKVRPVFDASAKEKGAPSLNNCLETGPNLIELIPAVLTRFRMRAIGVVSDIRKAFLQIGVVERDRDFLRFLWWEDGNENCLMTFRHRRVVFGVSSSPFLLGASLAYLLRKAPAHLEDTARVLGQAFYVDNCVTSVEDGVALQRFISQSQKLLASAQFDLRGWSYNRPKDCSLESEAGPGETPQHKVSVLGLSWDLVEDTLACDIQDIEKMSHRQTTKRLILSIAHRVFDLIGFSCPVTLFPKLLLQNLWPLKASWDEQLPPDILKKKKKICGMVRTAALTGKSTNTSMFELCLWKGD